MPLPSVEAATREAAVAAAWERYGSSARVVGVRRVRTGGVMGFFASERYVADVEEVRPAPAAEPRGSSREETLARIEAALRRQPVLPDPVDEVADLLAGEADGSSVDLYSRTSAPRPYRPAPAGRRTPRHAAPAPDEAPAPPAPATQTPPSAPSPFTAALARMVAEDLDVREAVHEAITAGAAPARSAAGGSATAPRSAAAGYGPVPGPGAGAGVPPAPTSSLPGSRPDGAAGPEPSSAAHADAAAAVSAREEAIAEVLRAALAQDTTDAALTGLLRGVLIASSEAAPAEPGTEEDREEVAQVLAPTATDPAPPALDATAVLSPLSLLPPPPGTTRPSRPPVPPSVRRPVGGGGPSAPPRPGAPAAAPGLATVTRLPVAEPPAAGPPAAEPPATERGPAEPTAAGPPAAEPPATERGPAEPPAAGPPAAEPPVAGRGPAEPRTPGNGTARGRARSGRAPDGRRAAARAVRARGVRARGVRARGVRARASAPEVSAPEVSAPPAGAAAPAPAADPVVDRLLALGLPLRMLGPDFAADLAASGTYAALTRTLAAHLPPAPVLPTGAGEVLVVAGPGAETLAAARSLAASLRLDGERLVWASRGDLAALAPGGSRISTLDQARARRQEVDAAPRVTIVAVDVPLRDGGRAWLQQVLDVFTPAAVWAVVEATRKPEDLGPWLDGLPRVDALIVQDVDLTNDPASVLSRPVPPVALLDGGRATAHRWASLLCERLEDAGP